MNHKKIILCGLPSSGKTTFIAALWHILFHGEISTALSLENYPEARSREYLSKISRQWCECSEIDRTLTEDVECVSLQLKSDAELFELRIPDMSGETWRSFWCNRVCPEHAFEWIQDASGIILFLHSSKIVPPIEIIDQMEMLASVGEKTSDSVFVPWDPKETPTQVVLIDILQSLVRPPVGHKGVKLSVVISAWDLVCKDELSPEKYLEVNLPLLKQFLNCGANFSDVRIFGVSAQGGDLASPDVKQELMAKDEPSKRIKIVRGHSECHDITTPIQWLIE